MQHLEQSAEIIPAHAPRAGKRMAIIGAGPLGLEAAHYAAECGFSVRVFEASAEIAPTVRNWQHLPMFSTWGAIRSSLGERKILE